MKQPTRQPSHLNEDLRIEKAWEDEAQRLLNKAIQGVLKEYDYANPSEAFVHVLLRCYLSLEDEEAGDACQVGRGGREKGIDAIYADVRARITYLIVGTFESKSFGPDILVDVDRAREFLCSTSPGQVKKDLMAAWDYYKEYLDRGFSTKYIIAVLGNLNNDAKAALEKKRDEFKKEGWDIECLERPDVLTTTSMPIPLVKGPDVKFSLIAGALEYGPPKLPRGVVATIEGGELADSF